MTIPTLQTLEIIETLENYISRNRPPEHIRAQVDLSYKIDGQSIILFEIRPRFDRPEIKHEIEFAKTTFVKSRGVWKVYWMRSNLKWYSYDARPTVKKLSEFIKLVEQDEYGCFLG